MTVKYKVSDFAKDLNVSAKKVLDELAAMGSTGKKNSGQSRALRGCGQSPRKQPQACG